VYLGTFDHPSAARAAGILEEGQLLLSCGTSWVCFYPLKERKQAVEAGMIVDPFLSPTGGCWAGMKSLSSISARIEGYIRKYIAYEGNIFDVFAQEAAKSEAGAGGLVLDLYSDAPVTGYPKHHIARAVMEAVIRLLQAQMDGLRKHGIRVDEAVLDAYFTYTDFREIIRVQSIENETAVSMVKENIGIAVMPSLTMKNCPPGVRVLELVPKLSRTIGVQYKRGTASLATERFVKHLQAKYR